jgi:hypothetical protein
LAARRSWCADLIGGLALAVLAACGGSGGGAPPGSSIPPPPQTANAEINLLFMGNSHTSINNVPGMVGEMVRAARPGRSVAAVEAPGWLFLGDRAQDPASLELLRGGRWSFVVLQAQEYSSSGQFTYPTTGAEALVRTSNDLHATPILFPEWPRRGIDESQRIYALHVSIAQKQAACVAPIPQAFELAYVRTPNIVLHAEDGNHSSPAGAFLASLVIAATMTSSSPDSLPYFRSIPVDEATQQRLRSVAAETVAANPPRQWCPGAALLPN